MPRRGAQANFQTSRYTSPGSGGSFRDHAPDRHPKAAEDDPRWRHLMLWSGRPETIAIAVEGVARSRSARRSARHGPWPDDGGCKMSTTSLHGIAAMGEPESGRFAGEASTELPRRALGAMSSQVARSLNRLGLENVCPHAGQGRPACRRGSSAAACVTVPGRKPAARSGFQFHASASDELSSTDACEFFQPWHAGADSEIGASGLLHPGRSWECLFCQRRRRSKIGPPGRRKIGPLSCWEFVHVVHGRGPRAARSAPSWADGGPPPRVGGSGGPT